jgi:hypothetical protein
MICQGNVDSSAENIVGRRSRFVNCSRKVGVLRVISRTYEFSFSLADNNELVKVLWGYGLALDVRSPELVFWHGQRPASMNCPASRSITYSNSTIGTVVICVKKRQRSALN